MGQSILDKIIDGIVDVAAGYLNVRTNPRSRAARAFVRLYTALVNCQEAYQQWKKSAEPKAKPEVTDWPFDDERDARFHEWADALYELQNAFAKVKGEIGVFAPGVRASVKRYLWSDARERLTEEQAHYRAKELDSALVAKWKRRAEIEPGTPEFHRLIAAKALLIDTDLLQDQVEGAIVDELGYQAAEKALRDFIRKEFKVEDLF